MNIFPRSRLRIQSRETCSAVPSRVSLLILHTYAESKAYSPRDSSRFPRPFVFMTNRHRVSPKLIGSRSCVPRSRSLPRVRRHKVPVVLKGVPVTGAALLFRYFLTLAIVKYVVAMLKVSEGDVLPSWDMTAATTPPQCSHPWLPPSHARSAFEGRFEFVYVHPRDAFKYLGAVISDQGFLYNFLFFQII